MPRNSIDGSLFPALEQEGRSVPHPDRAGLRRGEKIDSKEGENERKSEKIGENER